MDLIVFLAILSGLFLAIALSEPLAARLRLPVTVILAAIGIGIGAAAAWFFRTDVTDALNPLALAILTLPISSDLFIYIFLPVLIFQVSLTLNLRRLLDDWVPVLVLAVVAVVVATFVIGMALKPFTPLPLIACLLIGAIVSTTDPSAVVSIFRATPAPQRLARIVEGESLLNDAAAIALTSVFLVAVAARDAEPNIGLAMLGLPWLIVAGAAVGWLVGRLAVQVMGWMNPWPLAQVSISFATPFVTFLFTDQVIGASGVVAVVTAGMTVNFSAPGRISPPALAQLRDAWALIAYWAGGLIFVLAALLVPRILADIRPADVGLIFVTVVAALVARAIVLYGILPLLTAARLSPQVDSPYRIAILWGGLRGAVTLALALAVTENPAIFVETKRQVGIIATGFVLFTLLVQGTTLRWVISLLGLDRLSPLDRALSDQVVAVSLQEVRETVSETAREMDLTPAIVRDEAVRFGERLNMAVERADEARDILEKDRVTLGLLALAGHERDLILEAFQENLMSPRLADRMLADADRLIEATLTEGRSGYRAQARRSLMASRTLRAAEWLHNRFRLKQPLARLTEDRFEALVAHRQMLRALTGFIEGRIMRIHSRRVAGLLHDLIKRRIEDTNREMEGLRTQFPGYAEELERRLIRRLVLQREEAEYDQMTADGLIGPELRLSLRDQTAGERAALATRPRLDLRLQRSDIVRSFPLFSDLDPESLSQLARQMKTVYAKPGDILMRKDDKPDRVWFIASGAVEAEQASSRFLLGRGEMFGQLSLLLRRSRRARVTAISHTTLLTLEESRFLDLLRRAPQLCTAVQASAEKRGVALDASQLPQSGAPAVVKSGWLRRGISAAK
ncbi:cation:proton antiporter [Pseudotabrizicola alkalilacus]|uniref:Sodium:proton antiporter n=1 Tax=Pseudotabrizicola alkalilacus TaxID=2305252 RepID=A0A411YZ10_9RHOB|nr:cation:proton antiporter [Pseudotabrizicola alkalilacus]RGP36044.1 sodium:proton antiporter [Pseudotabrizicola alkalilacus]